MSLLNFYFELTITPQKGQLRLSTQRLPLFRSAVVQLAGSHVEPQAELRKTSAVPTDVY